MAAVVVLKPERVPVVVHGIQEERLVCGDPRRAVLPNAFHQGTVSRIIDQVQIHPVSSSFFAVCSAAGYIISHPVLPLYVRTVIFLPDRGNHSYS